MKFETTLIASGIAVSIFLLPEKALGFASSHRSSSKLPYESSSSTRMGAAPKRLAENVDGPLYVNEKCINCAACSHFAPQVFARSESDHAHFVHHQPSTSEEVSDARAALAACPVAAIRVESKARQQHRDLPVQSLKDQELADQLAINPKFNGLDLPFPRQIVPDDSIYFVGHHNEKTFGATPYLVKSIHTGQWVMVDTPKYSKSAVETVERVTGPQGPDVLIITHVDDSAGHEKWVEHYPSLQRIFHAGDLGRHNWVGDKGLEQVEILLHDTSPDSLEADLQAFQLDGTPVAVTEDPPDDMLILHTPGHSPGSISIWRRPDEASGRRGVLFTGDTYGYTTRRDGSMTAFARYGNNLSQQSKTIRRLVNLPALSDTISAWDLVLPGHGHMRDYRRQGSDSDLGSVKAKDLEDALSELQGSYRYTT